MSSLLEKFRGCLVGAAVGDVAGAVVEAESPGYIAKHFRSIDDILAAECVEEFSGPPWVVGRFTDDTQMMLCVAEWLIAGEGDSPQRLLARFAEAHEPFRRYGPGTEAVLRLYREHPGQWRDLATAVFPEGSLGNGSAMRVAPVGLAYFRDLKKVAAVARESSRPTHSHPFAYQGAVIQAVAVATATATSPAKFSAGSFLNASRASLRYFADLLQDTSRFARALDAIEAGLARGVSCAEMSETLGTGVTAHEAVPMALYCFLRYPDSYVDVIREAVFLGGDTDTIAAMAGAISGAHLGERGIPSRWKNAIREVDCNATAIEGVANRLVEKFGASSDGGPK